MRHILFVVLLLCAWPSISRAQSCAASANAAAFGAYQPLAGATNTSTATVTVTCNPGVVSLLMSYSIQLGTGGSGSFASRTLSNGAAGLAYQLYRDALYSQVWGDGVTGNTYSVSDGYTLGVVLPVTHTYTAYGRIRANQNVPVGAYSDTVTVFVSY